MNRKLGWVAATLWALAGCDSALPFRADQGQTGTPPALDGKVGTAGAAGQPVSFTASGGGDIPGELGKARSARVLLGGAMLPLVATGSTATAIATLSALVPPTVTLARPFSSTATEAVTFVVDGDRALVAWVAFK
jgi:hypothetical protein